MPVLAAARRSLWAARQGLARLADHLGRPYREQDLRREHARPAGRGARPWTYAAVASGLTLSWLATLFTAADAGDNADLLTLAADLECRDSHAQARARRPAVAGRGRDEQHPRQDGRRGGAGDR